MTNEPQPIDRPDAKCSTCGHTRELHATPMFDANGAYACGAWPLGTCRYSRAHSEHGCPCRGWTE